MPLSHVRNPHMWSMRIGAAMIFQCDMDLGYFQSSEISFISGGKMQLIAISRSLDVSKFT